MTRLNEALKAVKKTGHRLTPQRVIILSALAEGGGHVGVDAVFRRAKESYQYMDIATVYRTLHLLKKLGVVTEVSMSNRLHFELTDPEARHHHMVCRICSKTFDLSPSYLEEFRSTLAKDIGFEPDLEHFAIGGRCASCTGDGAP